MGLRSTLAHHRDRGAFLANCQTSTALGTDPTRARASPGGDGNGYAVMLDARPGCPVGCLGCILVGWGLARDALAPSLPLCTSDATNHVAPTLPISLAVGRLRSALPDRPEIYSAGSCLSTPSRGIWSPLCNSLGGKGSPQRVTRIEPLDALH